MPAEIPVIFISYSHDSDAHRERVLRLSERLRKDGFETRLDRYVGGAPKEGWPRWMMDQLDEAAFVLIVCTDTYYRRFRGHEEPGRGIGADWEGALITQKIYQSQSRTLKFVPILFEPPQSDFIPDPLRSLTHYVMDSEDGYQELGNFLNGDAGIEPRTIGRRSLKQRPQGTPLTFEDSTSVQKDEDVKPCEPDAEKRTQRRILQWLTRKPRRRTVIFMGCILLVVILLYHTTQNSREPSQTRSAKVSSQSIKIQKFLDDVQRADDHRRRDQPANAETLYCSTIASFEAILREKPDLRTLSSASMDEFDVAGWSRLGLVMSTVGLNKISVFTEQSKQERASIHELIARAETWASACAELKDRRSDKAAVQIATVWEKRFHLARAYALSQVAEVLRHSEPDTSVKNARVALSILRDAQYSSSEERFRSPTIEALATAANIDTEHDCLELEALEKRLTNADANLKSGSSEDAMAEYASCTTAFSGIVRKYETVLPTLAEIPHHTANFQLSRLGLVRATVGIARTIDPIVPHDPVLDGQLRDLASDAKDWAQQCDVIGKAEIHFAPTANKLAGQFGLAEAIVLSQRAELLQRINSTDAEGLLTRSLGRLEELKEFRDYLGAPDAYEKAIGTANLTRGRLLKSRAEYEEAQFPLKTAMDSYFAMDDLVNGYISKAEYADALAEIGAAEESDKLYKEAIGFLEGAAKQNIDRRYWCQICLAIAYANQAHLLSMNGDSKASIEGVKDSLSTLDLCLEDLPSGFRRSYVQSIIEGVKLIRGQALLSDGQYKAAIADLKQGFIQLDLASEAAYPTIAITTMNLGRAIHLNGTAGEPNRTFDLMNVEDGHIELAKLAFATAIEVLEKGLEKRPGNTWCHSKLKKCSEFRDEFFTSIAATTANNE